MRVPRGVLGVLLVVIGLVVTAAGAGAAFWLIGPDDTVSSGEQRLAVQGRSLVTSPELIDQHGPTLHVRARSTDGKPVFIGVARNFDVASYVQADAYTSLRQIRFPVAFGTEEHVGPTTPLAAPATLDWWVAKATGPGQQSLVWSLQDGPYQVVVMPADGRSPVDVQLELGLEIPHAFLTALALLVLGLILIVLGRLTFRARTALSVAAVLALTAGCAGLPQANTVTSLSRPAVTADSARAVLTRYDEVAAKAARTRDVKAIATVEADDRLERTQAAYRLAGLRKGPAKPLPSFASATVTAPLYNNYPMRFVASTGDRQLGLWMRSTAGAPWLRTFAATVDSSAKMPSITGAAEIPSDRTDPLATRFAAFLAAGIASPDRELFALVPAVTELLQTQHSRRADPKYNGTAVLSIDDRFTVASRPTTLLPPAGEAVAFFTLTEKLIIAADGTRPIAWAGGDESALSSGDSYEAGLTATYSHAVVMAVPATGTPRIVAFSTQLLEAGGY